MIELTYGFCSSELSKEIKSRIAPKLDQHAAYELNRLGNPICDRLRAAADFLVTDEDMLEVARWIVDNLPFDRLYYYGADRPIHVSYAVSLARQVTMIQASGKAGRAIPKTMSAKDFLMKRFDAPLDGK